MSLTDPHTPPVGQAASLPSESDGAPSEPANPAADPEQRLFALLDAYVESQRQTSPDQGALDPPAELLEAFPELGGLLDCLDSLECLAGPAPAAPLAQAAAPTILAPSAASAFRQGMTAPPDSFPPSHVPRDFGSYELLGEIGRGGMGVVYRARHKTLGASVAVKMIRASQLASSDEVRRFYQEARAAAGLSHSHIIKVHDVGERDGQHYLAMDLVDGPNLAELVKEGPLEPDRAAELLADVARAVHYLHSKQIIHRDLKPSNILLDAEGVPYITDFGLAKLLTVDSRQTSTGTIIGTPSYMAPEQASGHASHVTPHSDVYSLGAILYETLTGRPAFQEDNPLDTLLSVLERDPVLPRRLNPAVPRELEQICLRCMEKRPERRYPSAEALAEDLDRFLRREPPAVPPARTWHRFQRWLRREPALASRWLAIAIVAPIVQSNYWLSNVTAAEHWPVMAALGVWAAVSWCLQRLLQRERGTMTVPFVWAAVDCLIFTWILYLADPPIELLLAGYPLLIAAAGLWFRVRLVWFMTGASLLSYLVLAQLHRLSDLPAHYRLIYIAILLVVGSTVAYQVFRIRVMSQYFDRRGARRGSL